jgi:hypothetical protein
MAGIADPAGLGFRVRLAALARLCLVTSNQINTIKYSGALYEKISINLDRKYAGLKRHY